jgi:tellurite resistance protein TehA-like permease
MHQLEHGRQARSRPSGRGRFSWPRFFAAWVGRQASALDPACFSLVMATGIVSNAFFLEGYRVPSDALLKAGLVAYPWLCLLTALRVMRFGGALRADLFNPRMVFSFFTFVAGTNVLGLALDMRGFSMLALLMWLLAIAVWLILIYLAFGVLILLNGTNGAGVADGAWLNAIVGTQSLVILGAHIAVRAVGAGPSIFMLVHMLWTVGLGLYGAYVVLLCHRIFFVDLKTDNVTPLLWVVMGAAAISANAGATLVADDSGMSFLRSMQPFVDGVTLAMWTWATWWIPFLLLLGIWKHGLRREPLGYSIMLWSIVFPLGMYAVTSLRLSQIAAFPALGIWSLVVAWIALAAWCSTAGALAFASFRSARALTRSAAMDQGG